MQRPELEGRLGPNPSPRPRPAQVLAWRESEEVDRLEPSVPTHASTCGSTGCLTTPVLREPQLQNIQKMKICTFQPNRKETLASSAERLFALKFFLEQSFSSNALKL